MGIASIVPNGLELTDERPAKRQFWGVETSRFDASS